jgi:hypothetical protein
MKWMDEPEAHDYDAAEQYLSLLWGPRQLEQVLHWLRTSPVTTRKAKDIIRASGLEVLPATQKNVAKDLHKITSDHPVSPVLLVRDPSGLQIADGYHRVCAVYLTDADIDIPCKLVPSQ